MSIGAEVASHLPFLRRYARALTGSQSTGDAFVRATLEAALADSDLADSLRGGRVPLYRAFNKVWASAYLEVAELGPVFEKPYDPAQLAEVLMSGVKRGLFARLLG